MCNAVFGSKCPSAGVVTRRHRSHHNISVVLGRFDERRWRDARRTKHADA
jgi:hypothetical protein